MAQLYTFLQRHRRSIGSIVGIVLLGGICVALFVGISGLQQNPVGATVNGITELRGSFQPYSCKPAHCTGYISAGARSVFVFVPASCPDPKSNSTVVGHGKRQPTLGSATYTLVNCPVEASS